MIGGTTGVCRNGASTRWKQWNRERLPSSHTCSSFHSLEPRPLFLPPAFQSLLINRPSHSLVISPAFSLRASHWWLRCIVCCVFSFFLFLLPLTHPLLPRTASHCLSTQCWCRGCFLLLPIRHGRCCPPSALRRPTRRSFLFFVREATQGAARNSTCTSSTTLSYTRMKK